MTWTRKGRKECAVGVSGTKYAAWKLQISKFYCLSVNGLPFLDESLEAAKAKAERYERDRAEFQRRSA